MKQKIILSIFIILVLGLVTPFVYAQETGGDTEPGVYSITIKGKLVDQITGEPVKGAELMSAYEFSPSKVITEDNGNFQFTVSSDFKLKEGPEIGKSDIGAQWTFFTRCYDYAYINLQREYNDYDQDSANIVPFFNKLHPCSTLKHCIKVA